MPVQHMCCLYVLLIGFMYGLLSLCVLCIIALRPEDLENASAAPVYLYVHVLLVFRHTHTHTHTHCRPMYFAVCDVGAHRPVRPSGRAHLI